MIRRTRSVWAAAALALAASAAPTRAEAQTMTVVCVPGIGCDQLRFSFTAPGALTILKANTQKALTRIAVTTAVETIVNVRPAIHPSLLLFPWNDAAAVRFRPA